MDSKIILGRILQRLVDNGFAQVPKYNKFGFVGLKNSSIVVSRDNGEDTLIPFQKFIKAIEAYQQDINIYDEGPSSFRSLGITHITSPIYSLLHLLAKIDY